MRARRFSLLFLLAALLITASVSVLAFRQVQVANAASVTVVTTDTAMLAMNAVDTSVASYAGGVLQLAFPSQQPNSTYTYNSVFSVTNRTPTTITFTVAGVSGETAPGAHLTITDSATGTVYWQNGVSSNSKSLTSMSVVTLNVSVKLDAGVASGATQNLVVTVGGQ